MTPTRIIFFGTPEFAVASLDALVEAGRRPILVVSQPDRPRGRGRALAAPPVAHRAVELGLPLCQVERVRAPEFVAELGALAPDLFAVVAFGQIFPEALLALPGLGAVNVHASLLPRWRGASPIAAAIAAGDRRTGVATMKMEKGLDTGPVYRRREVEIGESESAGELAERLAPLGADLLVETVADLERGTAVPVPQSDAGATYAGRLDRAAARIDWSQPADRIARQVRAHQPEPGSWTRLASAEIKVLAAVAGDASPGEERGPGRILGVDGSDLRVAAGDDRELRIARAQRSGGRPLSGAELARGLRLVPGSRFE